MMVGKWMHCILLGVWLRVVFIVFKWVCCVFSVFGMLLGGLCAVVLFECFLYEYY